MPVNTPHPEVEASINGWVRIRDTLAGEEQVKSRGTAYLPGLTGAERDEYEGYKTRALFYNATARTVAGLVGAVYRKPPMLEWPESLEAFLENVTGAGTPFEIFSKQAVEENIALGRVGVLVDLPEDGGEVPYLTLYRAEDIISWRQTVMAGETVLSQVVLHEVVEEEGKDEFEVKYVDQWRVLKLTSENNSAIYTQEVWRKVEGQPQGSGGEFVMMGGAIIPSRRGERLGYIPFVVIGPSDIGMSVEKSPIQDLVDVNLSHYRTSADLEHGAHFTALPTYWATARATESGTPSFRVGSGVAWVLDEEGKAGILEYTGGGLSALETRLAEKQKLMAVLGARLLEDQKKGQEAAQTVRMRHSGEHATLASISDTTSRGLTIAMRWAAWWMGVNDSGLEAISVKLNKDFLDEPLSGEDLKAAVLAWQSGAISWPTLFWNLKNGEWIPEETNEEDEKAQIEAEPPLAMPLLPEPKPDPKDEAA